MLKKQAESEKSKALLTLELLNTKGVGVGYHSAEDELMMIVDAKDKLDILETLYSNSSYKIA